MDSLTSILSSHVATSTSNLHRQQDPRRRLHCRIKARFRFHHTKSQPQQHATNSLTSIPLDTIYAGAAGRIDFDPSSAAFSPDSFTWIASMTKIITSTCLMQLVERGVIGLDDDLRAMLPELGRMQILTGFGENDTPQLQDNVTPITLRHLLTHGLGLGYDTGDPDLIRWSRVTGRTARYTDYSRLGFTTPLKLAPGDGWYYGAAADWAGLLLEKLTGRSLGAYMRDEIFAPLGMQDTGHWPHEMGHTAGRTARNTQRVAAAGTDSRGGGCGGGLEPAELPIPQQHEVESGGSGLYSTAADFARFLHGLLGGELVSLSTLHEEMLAPQLSDAQSRMLESIAYDFGIQDAFAPEFPRGTRLNHGLAGVVNMEDVEGKRRKGSSMWSGALNGHWWIDPTSGIAAVLVTNVQPHGDPVVVKLYNELERAVYSELLPAVGK